MHSARPPQADRVAGPCCGVGSCRRPRSSCPDSSIIAAGWCIPWTSAYGPDRTRWRTRQVSWPVTEAAARGDRPRWIGATGHVGSAPGRRALALAGRAGGVDRRVFVSSRRGGVMLTLIETCRRELPLQSALGGRGRDQCRSAPFDGPSFANIVARRRRESIGDGVSWLAPRSTGCSLPSRAAARSPTRRPPPARRRGPARVRHRSEAPSGRSGPASRSGIAGRPRTLLG